MTIIISKNPKGYIQDPMNPKNDGLIINHISEGEVEVLEKILNAYGVEVVRRRTDETQEEIDEAKKFKTALEDFLKAREELEDIFGIETEQGE